MTTDAQVPNPEIDVHIEIFPERDSMENNIHRALMNAALVLGLPLDSIGVKAVALDPVNEHLKITFHKVPRLVDQVIAAVKGLGYNVY